MFSVTFAEYEAGKRTETSTTAMTADEIATALHFEPRDVTELRELPIGGQLVYGMGPDEMVVTRIS